MLCALCVLLAALAGLALGLALARRTTASCRGGPEDRDIAALERELAAADSRIAGAIGDARGTARELADRLGAIGESAAGTDGELNELAELIKELQRRSKGEGP